MTPFTVTRKKHRNEEAYPALWKAVDGAIRATQQAHPEIEIPNRASLVKRIVGQVLALQARPVTPGDK